MPVKHYVNPNAYCPVHKVYVGLVTGVAKREAPRDRCWLCIRHKDLYSGPVFRAFKRRSGPHRNEKCSACSAAIDYYEWRSYEGLCTNCFISEGGEQPIVLSEVPDL